MALNLLEIIHECDLEEKTRAFHYYKIGAEIELDLAQFILSCCYKYGLGT